MGSTLLLDRERWDCCLDLDGNIAVADAPYAIAQDVASAIKLFQSELWYDVSKGIPYFSTILGQLPPIAYMKAEFVSASLTVPDTVDAVCYISAIVGREVTGQVQVSDNIGQVIVVPIGQVV